MCAICAQQFGGALAAVRQDHRGFVAWLVIRLVIAAPPMAYMVLRQHESLGRYDHPRGTRFVSCRAGHGCLLGVLDRDDGWLHRSDRTEYPFLKNLQVRRRGWDSLRAQYVGPSRFRIRLTVDRDLGRGTGAFLRSVADGGGNEPNHYRSR